MCLERQNVTLPSDLITLPYASDAYRKPFSKVGHVTMKCYQYSDITFSGVDDSTTSSGSGNSGFGSQFSGSQSQAYFATPDSVSDLA
ncbi:hypothetical protein PanWU01x14_105420 [Parasponia andersonii]|uniref:Uncharacterized protein n=1 Tax=Parasponia andersonii TaxID=3476 RepID=A0A2P5D1N5_PARAD|nr:hypothetical protein PanWU01x14_105420 [Parasponia andersonii]